MTKSIFFRIIDIYSYICPYPYISLDIFIKRSHKIITETSRIGSIIFKMPERYAIISVQSIFRAKPHKAFRILQDSTYCVLRQSILATKAFKIIMFIYRLCTANKSNYQSNKRYNNFLHIFSFIRLLYSTNQM